MFTLFVRVCASLHVYVAPPPFSLSSSLPLAVPRIRISRRCVREFRNEHRIYGLARLDSIPFASSPAIPLDFVRLQTAPLSDARLSDQSSWIIVARFHARLGIHQRLEDPGAFAGFIPQQRTLTSVLRREHNFHIYFVWTCNINERQACKWFARNEQELNYRQLGFFVIYGRNRTFRQLLAWNEDARWQSWMIYYITSGFIVIWGNSWSSDSKCSPSWVFRLWDLPVPTWEEPTSV